MTNKNFTNKSSNTHYKQILFILLSFVLVNSTSLDAAYTVKDGKLIGANIVPTLPADQHYKLGLDAIKERNWAEAERQFQIITRAFPNTTYGQEGYYFLGIAQFNQDEFDLANDSFSQYLKVQNNPKFFSSTIHHKYSIADKFARGAKRRFFGTNQLPKWASGDD